MCAIIQTPFPSAFVLLHIRHPETEGIPMGHITLLSDLGLQDASVAIAKGLLMQHDHGDHIIDITHDIAPFNIQQAAYLIGSAFRNFPSRTFHVILFDLFSEKVPCLILCEHEGHYFLSPDNGILPLAFGSLPANTWQCDPFKKSDSFTDWINAVGSVISSLRADQTMTAALQPYKLRTAVKTQAPIPGASIIACDVIHIDQYENVVINMTRQQFEDIGKGRQFRLQFMRVEEINEISSNYTDAREGYKLCRFNSNGHLEICINRGKAASLFGLRLGSRNNDIKIFFE